MNGDKDLRLESYLAKTYPETFYYGNRILVVTKATERCPISDDEFDIQSCKYASSIKKAKSKSEARKGNSWYPKKIIFKRKPTKGMNLRRLPFKTIKRVHKNKKNDTKIEASNGVLKPVLDFASTLWSMASSII